MKKEKTGKCKYCERKIDSSCIRCYICDSAWEEGFNSGQEDIKGRLKEIFGVIKNLLTN